MPEERPFLEVAELSVAYGGTPVLRGVSLTVDEGGFVALLGASGCGKTTLLRAIAGFVRPSGGRIAVAGVDIGHLPPERRGTAMVFQSYALWPHMTAAQNIAYGLRLRGVPKAERQRRVERILEMLGLAGLGDRPVTQLSGGQRQRVALGRALAVDPRILLLDEPLSNLDARIRESVRHEIKELQQKLGITAVHVTHDREEAMVMADRIAVMADGRVVQFGTPEELWNRPRTPFVAAFMGADNRIPVRIAGGDGGRVRIEARAGVPAVDLPVARADPAGGVHLAGELRTGAAVACFRGGSARLLTGTEDVPDALLLPGRVVQAGYPGGVWRYAVEVAGGRIMVDDARRLAVGETVRVAVPAAGLHLFAETPDHDGGDTRKERGEP